MKRTLCAALLLLLSLSPAVRADEPEGEPTALPTIGLDEIERGQTGYGLSVFEGTEPTRFEVEVVGVMRNTSPGTSYILARLAGDAGGVPLDDTGVIAGMSGSPVFLDGRLAGAVAFSWSFSKGALAGITPIEGMRRIGAAPIAIAVEAPAPQPLSASGPPVSLADLVARRFPEDLVARELRHLRPAGGWGAGAPAGAAGPSLLWSAGGFGEGSRGLLAGGLGGRTFLAPAGTVGRAEGLSTDLGPGSAVAAVLIDGDLQLAANGTVSDRVGDSLVAFGHPFLGLGPVEVPMAPAEVVTVVASEFSSFKIANIGEVIGAFKEDRLLGIQGHVGVPVRTVPMNLTVTDATGQTERFRMRLARMPLLTPGLTAVATLGGLEVTSYTPGEQGLDLDVRFRISGYQDLILEQSFDGMSATSEATSFLTAVAGYLLQNDMERVEIDEIEVSLVQSDQPRTLHLTGAHAERSVVRPGETVRLHLNLTPYRGAPERRAVEVTVPEDAPDGSYYVFVGDGASIDAARQAVEPVEPVTFEQALRDLRQLHSRKQLGVLGVFAARGLSVAGEAMPQLPGTIASYWDAGGTGDVQPLRLAIAKERYETVDRPLSGLTRVDLTVRRKDPVPAGESRTTTVAGEPPTGEDE
jgi:hypothetical protein